MKNLFISISNNSIKAAIDIVSKGFALRDAIHKAHLKTLKGFQHKALNEFYDELLDLIDEFAETYQGRTNSTPDYSFEVSENKDANQLIQDYVKFLDSNKELLSSELQSLVDDILVLCNKTLHLLKLT